MSRALVLLAVVLTLRATPVSAAALDRPRSLDELKARIAGVLARTHVPGAGLALVARDRVLWAGGVGLADRDTGRPVGVDTLFRVGSITKSFVALALVKLSEQGRIELDAPVSRLAPELGIDNRWEREAPITVAHLLEHTAGFDDMHFNEFYAPVSIESATLTQILARNPRSRVARWRPGSRFSYANPGYTVAAYLIEKASGRRWFDYIRDELLVPLGMTNAALRFSPEVDARLSRGYNDGPSAIPYRAIYHHPAGNLMASPRELAALVQLWLNRGRIGGRSLVSVAGFERTERSETNAIRGLDVDYGLGNYGGTWVVRERGHDGGIDGFLSAAHYIPDRGVGYVVLLNSTGRGAPEASRQIRALVTEYLVGGVSARPPAVDVPAAELRGWVGAYHLANPRMQLFAFLQRLDGDFVVRFADGRLVVDDPIAHATIPLVPLGERRFRYPASSGSHVAFARDTDGRRVLFNWGIHAVEEPAWIAPLFSYGARAIVWLLFSALALPIAGLVLWRSGGARVGWLWPTLSATSFFTVPVLFVSAAMTHTLGERNRCTVAICALTIAFAVGAVLASWRAVRGVRDSLPVVVRLHRLAVALAALCATVFFAYYRLIGIRLWQY
jgi:CubicO group peptidase (beta-lactamase class C family)